ncbi:OB-fold nucleic acid binding domain-containing protein [Candidatus Nanohalococcus occultus]|uniref:SsDNA binding protein RPA14, OB-fold n=1 Tax=Candidatus Nanohalococcus occultus TaxID=2978047 RepID=A0ABY8CDN5_9ARCH|nr:ssDNA binding protein RPA14, OB-fold [Candidatus Nanohaloarchaeota archaeon SVXNc]
MPEQQRRAPAVPKDVTEIDPRDDIRVRVVGTIISKDEDSITVDDSTGTVEVFMQEELMEDLEENQRVRVLGRVLPTPDSFEIQAETVQDFEGVDEELRDRVKKVVNSTQ